MLANILNRLSDKKRLQSSQTYEDIFVLNGGFLCSENAVTGNICKSPAEISDQPSYEENERGVIPEKNYDFRAQQPMAALKSFLSMMDMNDADDAENDEAIFTDTIAANTTEEPFVCQAPGYYEDPNDCKKYYLCSPTLKQINYTCPGKLYFNEEIRLCSSYLSPKCKNLTMGNDPPIVNSTATPTPSIETTTTEADTTLTPVPTTSTSKITESTTPKGVFKCSYAGLFPDPNDATKYYRCNAALVYFHYSCPKNFEFNAITRKCKSKLSSQL